MPTQITAQYLFTLLTNLKNQLPQPIGQITFTYAGHPVVITATDIIGNSLQSWLEGYLKSNNFYYGQPANTQSFPDFLLNPNNTTADLLEVKAFMYSRGPAFDIANFDSYCDSVKDNPYRLDADYLIFGYSIDTLGNISINDIWLRKIWEIAGSSSRYPLKTQVKRGMIYNIRPNSQFKNRLSSPFTRKEDFLAAIYNTLVSYKGANVANIWKSTLQNNYFNHYSTNIIF